MAPIFQHQNTNQHSNRSTHEQDGGKDVTTYDIVDTAHTAYCGFAYQYIQGFLDAQ